jgi:hypothetical protein
VNRFWERVMLALVVCVPVPALALSGLSIPLPSVVERVAAALVPFTSAAPIEDGTTLASGRIVQAPGQASAVQESVVRSSPTTPVRVVRVRTTKAAAAARPKVVRVRATPAVPASTRPSTTFGEDTTGAAPEPAPTSPGGDTSTAPAPTTTPTGDEPTKPPTRPAKPTPVTPEIRPQPADIADVLPEVDTNVDVKPPEPVDEVLPEPKPEPKLQPPAPEPAARDPRHEKPFQTDSDGA